MYDLIKGLVQERDVRDMDQTTACPESKKISVETLYW